MDNKVILSVGVFLGVLIAVAGWMLTSASTSPSDGTTVAAATDGGSVDRREKILGGKRLIKRENTQQIMRSVTPEGVSIEERVGEGALAVSGAAAEAAEGAEAATYGLDEESVKAALDERMEDLQACYQTALFHTPELAGDMVLSLTLEPVPEQSWATVAAVDSDSDLEAPVFEGCITTVFEELRFEASEPTTLSWPVQFTAEDEADPAE